MTTRKDLFEKASKQSLSHIEKRDLKHLDPSERAGLFRDFIFACLDLHDAQDVISQPLWSDIMAFCIEMIGAWTLELEAAGDPSMKEFAKVLSRGFYTLHYSYPEDHEALGPSREEHIEIWTKRMEDFV